MLAILIVVVLAGLWFLFLGRGNGNRESVVKAVLLLYALLAAATEILSAFTILNRAAVSAVWLVLAVSVTLAFLRFGDRARILERPGVAADAWRGAGPEIRLAAICSAAAAFLALLTALVSPPNTWDAMTYHMPRVAHWIQQGSVAFYPTSIGRQNYQMPLPGFAVIHLQLLGGTDAFANLVQWSSFVLCALLVSLIARDIGLPAGGQAVAALAAFTLPTAILQGSSAQNDLVCAWLCLAFAWFLLRFRASFALADGLFAGLSLGLALLAKGTAYVFCAGIGLVLGVAILPAIRNRWRTVCAVAAGSALFILAANAGHWSRTFGLYGVPISGGAEGYISETMSPSGVAATLVRNVAKNLALPVESCNTAITRGVEALLGREISNSKTTWVGQRFSVGWSRHEDLAGNALHTLLIAAGFILLLGRRDRAQGQAGLVALSAAAAFLLFCAYLKWQPWHMRLEIPVFMLAIPAAAAGFSRWRIGRGAGVVVLAAALVAGSLPFLLANQTRPLIPYSGRSIWSADRASQYFAGQPHLRAAYSEATGWIRRNGAREVGLMLGEDDWEYPLWVFTGKHSAARPPEFRHVWVADVSGSLGARKEPPDILLVTLPITAQAIAEHGYAVVFESKPIRILKRRPSG